TIQSKKRTVNSLACSPLTILFNSQQYIHTLSGGGSVSSSSSSRSSAGESERNEDTAVMAEII
ncbi:unnamed protein product, partial [Ceratitis capitata]